MNTANPKPIYASGTDTAIYVPAGADELLKERRKIGEIALGQAVATPALVLDARYFIHTGGCISMSVVLNAVIIILELIGLYISISGRKWKIFAYYTQISNILVLISSIAYLIIGDAAAPARYLATAMLIMTFMVTVFILIPMGAGFSKMMLKGNGLFHHTLCPVLSFVSYVFFEMHSTAVYLPVAATVIYGSVMMWVNYKGYFVGPYPFLRVRHQSVGASLMWFVALIMLITGISFGLIVFSR